MLSNIKVWKALSGFLFLLCLLLVYAQIDMGVTLTYNQDAFKVLEENNSILSKILILKLKDSKKEELFQFLKLNFDGYLVHEVFEENTIGVNNVVFKFKDGKLQNISSFD